MYLYWCGLRVVSSNKTRQCESLGMRNWRCVKSAFFFVYMTSSILTDSYHLPHNAIRVDELNFMLHAIDTSKSFYTYDELRLLFLSTEIQADVFRDFHAKVHSNLCSHQNPKLRTLYQQAQLGNNNSAEAMLEHGLMYTNQKSFRQVWNEFVRDYTEFFAFLGLLPTYYKGLAGGENRHYVTSLLKDYQSNNISLQDLLLAFKFRNSSKDYTNLEMYHIEVRPFVLALKSLQFYKKSGLRIVNPHIISAIVVYCHNENDSLQNNLHLFPYPAENIEYYQDVFHNFSENIKKEIARVTLFLKPYLIELGLVTIRKKGNTHYYEINNKVDSVSVPHNVAFCNGHVGKYKLTPLIGKVIYTCLQNPQRDIPINSLFDSNFTETDKRAILRHFQELGIIKDFNDKFISVAGIEHQYALNPFTDFMTYGDACYVAHNNQLQLQNEQIVIDNTLLREELDKLKQSALSSDGAAYEESLYFFLNKNIHFFSNLNHYGTSAMGKRLSDIAGIAKIFSHGATKNILIIMECKAANAIRAFDERKERDDIINLLKAYKNNGITYDGVWYWVTDSNSLPDTDIHGGYRDNQMSKSLVEKLNILQFDISEESRLPSIVTAFSIDALVTYLSYLYQHTQAFKKEDKITETTVPHFWRWSKKFMNVQYVTIHKQMNL